MAILAPEDLGRKPIGATPDPTGCFDDGKTRTGSLKQFLISQGICPNNPSQKIPVDFKPGGGGMIPPTPGGGVIPPPVIPPPPIAKVPKLPPIPPLPPPPLPPGAPGAPSQRPATPGASGGGGAAGGGIMLLIGLALLASFGKR